MVKSYSVKSKFTKKQINALNSGKSFTHNKDNEDYGEFEVDLDLPNLKSYNKFKKLNKKGFRVKSGDGIFDSIRRGFQKAGDTLKNTFSEKNAKDAVKIVVPGVVGGATSLAVGTLASGASVNPVVGAMAGGAAGAVTAKITSKALNKSLGDGIGKYKKYTGDGLAEMFMTFISDPRVQTAAISTGSYLSQKAIDAIINKIGRTKVNDAKKLLDNSGIDYTDNEYYKQANDYYQKGIQEQQKMKALQNSYTNPVVNTPKKKITYEEPSYSFGNGVVGYNLNKQGKGVGKYGKGIGKYGGSIAVETGAIQNLNKKQTQFGDGNYTKSMVVRAPKIGGSLDTINNYAEQIGAIAEPKRNNQFERMLRVRSFRK